jgi:hypothetical protein
MAIGSGSPQASAAADDPQGFACIKTRKLGAASSRRSMKQAHFGYDRSELDRTLRMIDVFVSTREYCFCPDLSGLAKSMTPQVVMICVCMRDITEFECLLLGSKSIRQFSENVFLDLTTMSRILLQMSEMKNAPSA